MDRQQLGLGDVERLDLGRLDVELIDTVATTDAVVDEIRSSCRRRARADDLLDVPGAVGVLGGAAPVVWVFDDRPADLIGPLLQTRSDVRETYIAESCYRTRALLGSQGWQAHSWHAQVVHRPEDVLVMGSPDIAASVRELGPEDLPSYVAGLADTAGVEPAVIEAAYPSDFFECAAPVRVFGAVIDGVTVGGAAVRRQVEGALLFGVWVATECRRQGLGHALAAAAVTAAYDDGARFTHAQAAGAGLSLTGALGMRPCGAWLRHVRRTAPIG